MIAYGRPQTSVDRPEPAGLIGFMSRVATALAFSLCICASAAALVGGAAPAGDAGRSLVMIISSRSNLCTGAALTRDLVLTAGHCVAATANYLVLPAKGAAPMAIRTVSVHPGYDPKSFANNRATADVALIKVADPLPASITPAPLNRADASVAVGDRFIVGGYGVTTRGDDSGIGVARTAALIATGQPGTLQIRLFDPSTRGERAGLGACTGDSGGPVFRDVNGRMMVVGVVSWSTGPKLSDGCGGLTGVTPLVRYRDWIIQTADKLGSAISP
jgi:secreted trypsin-like serine protease